jgi:hypothetical protein
MNIKHGELLPHTAERKKLKRMADSITGIKIRAIEKAKQRYGRIYPCNRMLNLDESFTCEDNMLLFWFNSRDKSTHVIVEPLPWAPDIYPALVFE